MRRYDPRTSGQRVASLSGIIRAKELRTNVILRAFRQRSGLVRGYGNASGEMPIAPVNMTVLQNMCPREVRAHFGCTHVG